jgi:hypothetical protein
MSKQCNCEITCSKQPAATAIFFSPLCSSAEWKNQLLISLLPRPWWLESKSSRTWNRKLVFLIYLFIYLFEVLLSLFGLSVAGLSLRWSRLNPRPNSVGFVVVGKVALWQVSLLTRRTSPVSFYLFTTDDIKHYRLTGLLNWTFRTLIYTSYGVTMLSVTNPKYCHIAV